MLIFDLESSMNKGVSIPLLVRALNDLFAIHGTQTTNRDLDLWIAGYIQSARHDDCAISDSECYEAGFAFGYAEGQGPLLEEITYE